ncbi:unnamed protein product [Pedinophyceae sp. YPF-701]|nr:unnamed protein product [Pedinophyceae sp. YPF-701]
MVRASGPGGPPEGVKVFVRIRPPQEREYKFAQSCSSLGNSVRVESDNVVMESKFDRVFTPEATQQDVFESIEDSIDGALEGYNTTVFAYGQTGTGKTFTMAGADYAGGHDYRYLAEAMSASRPATQANGDIAALPDGAPDPSKPGLIPRVAVALFEKAASLARRDGKNIAVYASYLEIYNDKIHDLLQPYKPTKKDFLATLNRKTGLQVRDAPGVGVFVPGLSIARVRDPAAILSVLKRGNRHRAVRHTHMNVHSSRSHTLLQILIEQRSTGVDGGELVRSKINLVDLAGSEKWAAATNEARQEQILEMNAINQSLSALASVVSALTTGASFVPYRDSRLTHLLQDSLGGNCRTTLIATVSPSSLAFDETVSTLRFADRARSIVNRAVKNAVPDVSMQLEVKDAEINRLRNLLALVSRNQEGAVDELQQQLEASVAKLGDMEAQLMAMEEVVKSERARRRQLTATLRERDDEIMQLQDRVIKLQGAVQRRQGIQQSVRDREHAERSAHAQRQQQEQRYAQDESFDIQQLSDGDASSPRRFGPLSPARQPAPRHQPLQPQHQSRRRMDLQNAVAMSHSAYEPPSPAPRQPPGQLQVPQNGASGHPAPKSAWATPTGNGAPPALSPRGPVPATASVPQNPPHLSIGDGPPPHLSEAERLLWEKRALENNIQKAAQDLRRSQMAGMSRQGLGLASNGEAPTAPATTGHSKADSPGQRVLEVMSPRSKHAALEASWGGSKRAMEALVAAAREEGEYADAMRFYAAATKQAQERMQRRQASRTALETQGVPGTAGTEAELPQISETPRGGWGRSSLTGGAMTAQVLQQATAAANRPQPLRAPATTASNVGDGEAWNMVPGPAAIPRPAGGGWGRSALMRSATENDEGGSVGGGWPGAMPPPLAGARQAKTAGNRQEPSLHAIQEAPNGRAPGASGRPRKGKGPGIGAGAWTYILGTRASSVQAKKLALMDNVAGQFGLDGPTKKLLNLQ